MAKARVLLAVAAAALFAACSGGASSPAGGQGFTSIGRPAQPVPAPDQSTAQSLDSSKQGTASNVLGVRFDSDKVLVLTAQLSFKAADPWTLSDRVQSLAIGIGGDVVGVSQSGSGDNKSAMVTVRVPNTRFNDALAQIKALEGADLIGVQVTGEDKTDQFIDLDARLKAKQQEESRYLALLAKADKIDDILKIDQVLSGVRAQVEQLQGQLNALKNRSAMATISVSIATGALGPQPVEIGWQPAKTFQTATTALVSLLRVFADAAIWAFVWLWIPLLGLGLAVLLARARTRISPNV